MPVQQITIEPKTVNLKLYSGDDSFIDLVVTDSKGTPVDLTGATVYAQVRSEPHSSMVVTSWDWTIDLNVVHLHLLGAESAKIPPVAAWDVEVVDVDGTVLTLAAGSVSMKKDVTR